MAENKNKRNSFIVIDGKQRLLTIAGYKKPSEFQYWTKKIPKTTGLKSSFNEMSYQDIIENPELLRNLFQKDILSDRFSMYVANS